MLARRLMSFQKGNQRIITSCNKFYEIQTKTFLEPLRMFNIQLNHGHMASSRTMISRSNQCNTRFQQAKRWNTATADSSSTTTTTTATEAATISSQMKKNHAESSLIADKGVATWLFATATSVFIMIVLGGVTRLTRSGLSMTDWRPQGSLPPMNEEEWEFEFNKYKKFPEYQKMNKAMTVEEFKFIFYMEWGHRMWGRCIGLIFTLPAIYLFATGRIRKPLYRPLLLMFSLGGMQGAVGWWMVKSGLEIPEHDWKEPRVSPYRLTAHLTMAFTIYSLLVYTGMTIYNPNSATQTAQAMNPLLSKANVMDVKLLMRFRSRAIATSVLICVTALSGAFVAGNDAGHAYNSFPMMGDHWVPPEVFEMTPIWVNFFENTALVQLDHRILALSTLTTVLTLLAATRHHTALYTILPRNTQLLLNGLGVAVCGQVALGITTLLLYVPVSIGACHQAGAMVLWTIALGLVHSLRYVKVYRVLIRGRGVHGTKMNALKQQYLNAIKTK